MKQILPNLSIRDDSCLPTLVIAMPDLLLAEMISEWQFNCNFRNIAVMENGKDFLRRLQALKPDFLLIDSELPFFKIFDLVEKLKQLNLTTKIIVYASKMIPDYLHKFLSGSNNAIKGFIHKGCGVMELENCLKEVFLGKKYLSGCINNYLSEIDSNETDYVVNSENITLLANREREVWNLMTQGKTERQMSDFLCIGVATVKTYKKRIKDKLNFMGKGKLTYLALKNTSN